MTTAILIALLVALSPAIAAVTVAALLIYFVFLRGFIWPLVSEAFFGGRKW
jgi:hypothetical protein